MIPNTPAVAAVILNWHGREDTLACLRALAAMSYPSCSAIVLDNECNELSASELSALLPRSRYLHSATNLGFAAGANLGMRHALSDGAQYVWFLNNDAEPDDDALSELVAVIEGDRAIGAVGAKIVQHAHPQRLDSIALAVNPTSGRVYLTGHDEVDHGQYDQCREVPAVSGCAMLVRSAVCEQLDGFDERYFAYLEDADLCLRARAAGWRIAVAPRARVRHKRAVATAGRQSVSSLYYATRNHLMLMARHGSGGNAAHGLRAAAVVGLNLMYAWRGGGERSARLRAVWHGMRDYQRGITGPLPSLPRGPASGNTRSR